MSFRYVLEAMSEEQILEIDRSVTIANASITRYRRSGDRLELTEFAATTHLEQSSAEVTEQPEDEARDAG